MKKQIGLKKQIRIIGLLLLLVFAVTLSTVMGTPVTACPMDACKIEASETTVTAGEEITFIVSILDIADSDEGYANYVFGSDPYNPQDGCKFEIDSAAGGSWNVNTYTADVAGDWEVTVSCTATIEGSTNTREDSITITVLPAEPTLEDAGFPMWINGTIIGGIALMSITVGIIVRQRKVNNQYLPQLPVAHPV
ncbi:hypothetical protein ACFLYB_05780 [Chloroflexota bacterium]